MLNLKVFKPYYTNSHILQNGSDYVFIIKFLIIYIYIYIYIYTYSNENINLQMLTNLHKFSEFEFKLNMMSGARGKIIVK